jgi:DNA-binding response OmpR family regulator
VARILLVEDEDEIRCMLAEALVDAGHDVIEAESGDAASVLLESLVHRFHEGHPRRGIPSVTMGLVSGVGVNVVRRHRGSTSAGRGVFDRGG